MGKPVESDFPDRNDSIDITSEQKLLVSDDASYKSSRQNDNVSRMLCKKENSKLAGYVQEYTCM